MILKMIYLFVILLIFPNITFAQLQFPSPSAETDSESVAEQPKPINAYPESVPSPSSTKQLNTYPEPFSSPSAEQPITTRPEMDSGSFSERLAAAHQFLKSASPLFRDIIKNGFQNDFIGFKEDQINRVLDIIVNRFEESVVLLSTLAKHFSAKELTQFANFLNTKEVLSAVKKVDQELASDEDQQFEQDFEGIANEINAMLKDIPQLLRNQ